MQPVQQKTISHIIFSYDCCRKILFKSTYSTKYSDFVSVCLLRDILLQYIFYIFNMSWIAVNSGAFNKRTYHCANCIQLAQQRGF